MRFRLSLLLPFVVLATSAGAQKLKSADKTTLENLKRHVSYLADDKLEGRRAGSPGEKLAMEYISAEFTKYGIQPKGTDGFYQAFEIAEGKKIGPGTHFMVNEITLTPGKDFFPFPFSAAQNIEALTSVALQEPDMPWFVDLADILAENASNPHFDLTDYIRNNSAKAHDRGASAVIIYNSSATDDKLAFNAKDKSAVLPVPVVYINKNIAQRLLADKTASINLKLKTEITQATRKGHNVVGFIDNKASRTVILGAHFDHLGYGEDGNSMIRTGEKMIHNGADDNASGTAALIELSRILKGIRKPATNFLFIAFSGEELGLYGSKYFTEHPTIDLGTVNYMINMDMIGRLNDSTRTVAIGGFGTSPQWSSVIRPHDRKLSFSIKIDSSGTGPSDHTSFYRKDIPVLFFFTGQHKDYHRPSDDAGLINYMGQLEIVQYINKVITTLDKQEERLTFTKTREVQMSVSPFKVTMGIMPDYTYTGNGVRADGVTEGRPAFNAGLKAGDVIIKLGDHVVNSVETYMQALNKFSKGEKTRVKFKRGNETLEADLQF